MTWRAMVDMRRAIAAFFLVMLVALLGMFMCVLALVGGNILAVNSSSPVYQSQQLYPFE